MNRAQRAMRPEELEEQPEEVPDYTFAHEGRLREFVVGIETQSLGMRFYQPPPGRAIVAEVDPDGWADRMGIFKGCELVAIDQQDVPTMTTQAFIQNLQRRPVRLTMLFPDQDELDYALGYDEVERPDLGDLGDMMLNRFADSVRERRRIAEISRVLERLRADVLELRQRKAHHVAEVARLEQLVAFGDDPTYCRNCDLRMLNMQVLLRALGRHGMAVFADFAYTTGDYEILAECAEALNSAAFLDSQIAELATYLAESLPQVPSLPPLSLAPPRELQAVLPTKRVIST